MLDAWFDLPYWVVDILPEQVPGGSRGQYFAVEQFYLQPTRMADLHRRFADMLLKLNCYDDFAVYSTDEKRMAAILRRNGCFPCCVRNRQICVSSCRMSTR